MALCPYFGYCTTAANVWERIAQKHLAPSCIARESRACQTDVLTKSRLVCELSYGTCPILCVLCNPCHSRWYYGHILVIAPTNVWKRIGEKHLAPPCIPRGRGVCQTGIFNFIDFSFINFINISKLLGPNLCDY